MAILDTDDSDVGDDTVESAPNPLADLVRHLFEHEPWRAQASCRGQGPDVFFGFAGESHEMARVREWDAHTRFCTRCPVAVECRAAGRRHHELGVWGGEGDLDRAAAGYGSFALTGREASRIRYALAHGEPLVEVQP